MTRDGAAEPNRRGRRGGEPRRLARRVTELDERVTELEERVDDMEPVIDEICFSQGPGDPLFLACP